MLKHQVRNQSRFTLHPCAVIITNWLYSKLLYTTVGQTPTSLCHFPLAMISSFMPCPRSPLPPPSINPKPFHLDVRWCAYSHAYRHQHPPSFAVLHHSHSSLVLPHHPRCSPFPHSPPFCPHHPLALHPFHTRPRSTLVTPSLLPCSPAPLFPCPSHLLFSLALPFYQLSPLSPLPCTSRPASRRAPNLPPGQYTTLCVNNQGLPLHTFTFVYCVYTDILICKCKEINWRWHSRHRASAWRPQPSLPLSPRRTSLSRRSRVPQYCPG